MLMRDMCLKLEAEVAKLRNLLASARGAGPSQESLPQVREGASSERASEGGKTDLSVLSEAVSGLLLWFAVLCYLRCCWVNWVFCCVSSFSSRRRATGGGGYLCFCFAEVVNTASRGKPVA